MPSRLNLSDLPQLTFTDPELRAGEIHFCANRELQHVICQNIPSYLVLCMPGMHTHVILGFPVRTLTRVYVNNLSNRSFVGEAGSEEGYRKSSPKPNYRFGMELRPFLSFPFLDAILQEERSKKSKMENVVNFVVLNNSFAYDGVLIRILRIENHHERYREWMEVYHFATGNEYLFHTGWRDDPHTRLIARFVPANPGTADLSWRPQPFIGEQAA